MSQPIFLYVTVPTKEIALSIAHTLLEKKLIACVNMFPITSVYTWQGQMGNEQEQVMLLKTFDHVYQAIQDEIQCVHPYKIPCITKINIHPNALYLTWMEEQVTG